MGYLINNVVILSITLVGLSISFWVYFANKKARANQLLALLIILSILFVFTPYLSNIFYESDKIALLLTRFSLGAVSLGMIVFYLFATYFPKKINNYSALNVIIVLLGVISFFASVATNFIVRGISGPKWGIQIIPGIGMNLFYVVLTFVIVLSFFFILKKYFKISKAEKVKIQYFLFGLLIFIISNIIFNIISPLALRVDKYSYIGDYSVVFFFGLTAYAIVKHRLMDIRMVVARSVAYAIMIAILAGIYIGSVLGLERVLFPESVAQVSFGQILLRAAITLVIVFTFQPLNKFITKATDKVFFKQAYNPDELLDTLAHTMSSSIVLIELMYKTLNILIEEMKVSRGFFALMKDKDKIYTTQGIGYKGTLEVTVSEISALTEDGVLIYEELEERSREKKILARHDARVAIPLKTKSGLSGVLFLGEKSSGDMYASQDIRIFEIVAPEIAVALENAKSYEEIQKFNAVLRSEVKKATRELEMANENLRELDKAKDEFISMASHQLRTPLTAIKGYLSMLLEGDAGEIKMAQFDFIKESYDGANRMVALINDLLNVSRMETGRFFLEIMEFDLNKVVEEEVQQLQKLAKDKGLKLKLEAKKVPQALGDELKMRQVVMNFMDNAIHYTLDGSVTVKLYPDAKDKDKIYFTVEDTGLGIPEAQQEHLFSKFYRAENARRVRPDGTGLGIFMAKKVIEEHGAELIFESEEGKGSRFGFCLSRKEVELKQKVMPSMDFSAPASADKKVSELPQDKMDKECKEAEKRHKAKAG